MPRTQPADVQDVLDTSLDDAALEAFIGVATEVVDDVADADPSIPESKLTKIERFYAAYLASAGDPRADSQSGSSRSISFRDVDGAGNASHLQVATTMDPTGIVRSAELPSASLSVPNGKRSD
jgi:hypothetical protein